MPRIASSGKCRLCGQLISKQKMAVHLKACLQRRAAASAPGAKSAPCFHLIVEATYDPVYWIHMEAPASATFGRLDRVLRDLWLECCGHMSAFRFPRKRVRPLLPQGFAQFAAGDFEEEMDNEQRMMAERLGKRLQVGTKLDYEYDFGSTTALSLRVLNEYAIAAAKPKIRLLARNEPPDIACDQCGKPATQACTECEGTPLCDPCTAKHECGEEMLLPIINSPRAGVCGYCGPSVEP